jgi:hypothetical protein
MAATQGKFERTVSRRKETALNQDLVEDLEGRHQGTSRNRVKKTGTVAGLSKQRSVECKSPSENTIRKKPKKNSPPPSQAPSSSLVAFPLPLTKIKARIVAR